MQIRGTGSSKLERVIENRAALESSNTAIPDSAWPAHIFNLQVTRTLKGRFSCTSQTESMESPAFVTYETHPDAESKFRFYRAVSN